ncbi:hypothetical protein GCM10009582_27970 [Arthrobacter flavus]
MCDEPGLLDVEVFSSIAQARTAVLKPPRPKVNTRLVHDGPERELQRLVTEFNDGAPFEEHEGEFRQGRDLPYSTPEHMP